MRLPCLSAQATIPQIDPNRTWKLLLKTDANSNQTEVNELNNLAINSVIITAPDLVITNATAPAQTAVSGAIDLTWTVTNQGNGVSFGSWNDTIYLSNDNVFDAGDLVLGSKSNSQNLITNGSYTASQRITLPSQYAGDKYLIVRTNSNGSQVETDRNNNATILPLSIQAPDLVISNLIAPTIAQLGDRITATWQVSNSSSLAALSSWNDGIYLSQDGGLDSSDILLTSIAKSSVGAGNSYNISVDLNIPDVAIGNYYLIAATDKDRQQLESNETNNTIAAQIQLKYPPYTDLVVDTISTPTTGTSGEEIRLSWRVSNQGQLVTNSNNWNDRVYISTKSTFDNTAIAIGTLARTSKLDPGDNYLQTANFTLPNGISGNYYVFVTADINNQVGEYKFEGNNITVSGGAIAITRKPDPDLVVTSLTYAANGQPGQTIQVDWTVNNNGLGIAKGNWQDRIYLTNASGTVNIPLQVKSAPTNLLAVGGTYPNSATITLPANLADGNYQIAIVTNEGNTLFEGQGTGNNKSNIGQITIGHPDLVVTIDPTPIAATSGTSIPIVWNVQNLGTANTLTNWQDRVYISTKSTFDASATLLGSVDRTGTLAVNDSYQGQLNIDLPIDYQGRYYLFIKTDATDRLNESGSEANNLTAIPIDITLAPYADLVVSNVIAPELVIQDPAQIDVSWQVTNQGTGAGITSNWIDRVVLVGEGREIIAGEFTRTGELAVGQSYTRTESISLPASLSGKYRVEVRTDATSRVFENGNEANNSGQAVDLLTVAPIPYADLFPSNLVTDTVGNSGRFLTASWQVNNQGIGPTNGNTVYEEVSLATDPQGNNIVAKLGVFQQLGGLSNDRFYDRNESLRLPNGLNGTFYLVVKVSGAFELDKTGNNPSC